MAATSKAIVPIRKVNALYCGKERASLGIDSLDSNSARVGAYNDRQYLVDCVGLTEENNIAIAHRGVSLLRELQAGFYLPRYAASLKPSSPRFGHISTASVPHNSHS